MGERLPVLKMNGIGNAIAVVDLRAGGAPLSGAEARALADPMRGLCFDQLMALHPAQGGDAAAMVRIYNADGSDAGACGNGMRCVADVLFRETRADRLVVEGPAGPLVCFRGEAATYTVDMGPPRFGWRDIPLSHAVADTGTVPLPLEVPGAPALGPAAVASMGNPHAVFFVADLDAVDLGRWGPLLERHPLFPDRANITLARVDGPARLTLKVWERGAGLTRACGSAACAAAVLAHRAGRTGRVVEVTLPGGTLRLEWREGDGHVLMTGPVETEAVGFIDRATLGVALGRAA
jgi:diaminopimelate epimerase